MSTLGHDQILELHAAAVDAGLSGSRIALLSGVPPAFVASIPEVALPNEQLLADLSALNSAGRLADGTLGMEVWLKNAAMLTRARSVHLVFERYLVGLERATLGQGQGDVQSRSLKQGRLSWIGPDRILDGASAGADRTHSRRVWIVFVSLALIFSAAAVGIWRFRDTPSSSGTISIEIDSSPPGAKVVLVEPTMDTDLGRTPCVARIRRPDAKTAIFLRVVLDGYKEKFEELSIPEGHASLRRSYRLERR